MRNLQGAVPATAGFYHEAGEKSIIPLFLKPFWADS